MQKKYFVAREAKTNGVHEVHDQTCRWLPASENRIFLGEHLSCHTAIIEAKRYYKQVNGCKRCSLACNK
jgi:hypothetical protein